jgi:hypothetical protein
MKKAYKMPWAVEVLRVKKDMRFGDGLLRGGLPSYTAWALE